MKLSFSLTKTQTSVIYAPDDPEYVSGSKQDNETFNLTKQQENLKLKFMGIIEMVRAKNMDVDPERLIEGIHDYLNERRAIEDDYR